MFFQQNFYDGDKKNTHANIQITMRFQKFQIETKNHTSSFIKVVALGTFLTIRQGTVNK